MSRKLSIAFNKFFSRINGISAFGGGLNWEPEPDQKEGIRKLLIDLEDRRALEHGPEGRFYDVSRHHTFMRRDVCDSVIEIRKALGDTLKHANYHSDTVEILEIMRTACRETLEGAQIVSSGGSTKYYITKLGGLRLVVGLSVSKLADHYSLQLSPRLSRLSAAALAQSKIISDDVN